MALQTYNALEKLRSSTIQKYKHSSEDVGVANLQCLRNLPSLPYKDTKFEGGCWRYKLTVSVISAQSAIQRYSHSRGQVYHTKTVQLKCGRWHHKIRVSLKLAKCTIRRYKNSRVGVGDTNLLQCPSNSQSLPYKDTKHQGWMLSLET